MIADVIQIDREAAASGYYAWVGPNPVIPRKMLAGEIDDHSMIQAFARHRVTAKAMSVRQGQDPQGLGGDSPASAAPKGFAQGDTP